MSVLYSLLGLLSSSGFSEVALNFQTILHAGELPTSVFFEWLIFLNNPVLPWHDHQLIQLNKPQASIC